MADYDVLVAGGGATGVGVARELAMRDLDVCLVERDGLNAGTSGRSHGLLHSGARYADDDPEGAAECIAENRVLREIAGACIADTGGYFLSLAGDDPDYFERKLAACGDVGIPAERVDADDLRADEPVADDVERAFAVPDAAIYPARLVAATAAGARDAGADLRLDAPVTDLHVADGRVVGATAGGDRIDAAHVVNATGAWAGEFASLAGLDVEMAPTRGVMVAVENPGVSAVLNRCRPPDDGDIVVPHRDQAVLGTTSVAVDGPEGFETDDAEVERVVAECAAMTPGAVDAPLERTYWGVRPLYVADREAHAGRQISRGFHLLDHEARDGLGGLTTVVGGKLTTYRLMAEAVGDHLADRLGGAATSGTADAPLPGHDDPARLDALVREFRAGGPADEDVVTQ
jgi:glycerol-3-phosphate dehydrogenase